MFYFLFLRVLRCFTSPRSLHTPYIFRCGSPHSHVAGFPHSDTLGSQPVYRLPEAYRRFPRPSSAPDAKASTMRSYTLITPKKIWLQNVCVRKFHTKISQEKSHYITTQTLPVLLMLASTIRFSNHYQTPPTPTQPKAAGLDGLVLLVETTPNHCWLVCDSRTQ